jgi:RNA polymerase sigma factor (sigma-70 family)
MTTETGKRTDRQLLTVFASDKDEEAFAELVRRHGPMVLGVCRQMLRNDHDAEDTFQATFLVLARKAGSIHSAEALPNWLYGVATRLAMRNRALAGRRRAREVPLVDALPGKHEDEPQRREMKRLLLEEIGRLPETYRLPFILCYLDGKTNEEAARQLNCAPGTVFSRLARARKRLRERLGRRGLIISSSLLAATLAALPREASAAVSTPLLQKTVRGAVSFSTGRATGKTAIPIPVLKLAERHLATSRKRGTRTVLAISLASALGVCTAGGLLTWQLFADKPVETRIKGTWALQTYNINGTPFDVKAFPVSIVLGDNGALMSGDAPGTYRLDTRTKPMQMEQIIEGNKSTMIFRLQEDTLTVCYPVEPGPNLPRAPLPTDFEPGSGKLLITYSRVRP